MVLGKSFIQFYVELPELFVPDNNFGQKVKKFNLGNPIFNNSILKEQVCHALKTMINV